MLKIEADPAFMTVTPGTEVKYRLVSTNQAEVLNEQVDGPKTSWSLLESNEHGKVLLQQRGGFEAKVKYDDVGKFLLLANIELGVHDNRFGPQQQNVNVFIRFASTEYPQSVQPAAAMMKNPSPPPPNPANPPTSPAQDITHVQDPVGVLNSMTRYLQVLQAQGTRDFFPNTGIRDGIELPTNPVAYTKQKAVEQTYKDYIDKLSDLLSQSVGWTRVPVIASHLEDSQRKLSELHIFVAHPPTQGTEKVWVVVDWTYPANSVLRGEYTGTGVDDASAIKEAIAQWKSGCQYPPGTLTFDLPPNVTVPGGFKGSFRTTGRSTLGAIADFLEKVAMVAGIMAAIIMFITPVPGSQLAAAALAMAIFTSASAGAASAVFNIAERHQRGVWDSAQDGLDTLSVVACVLGVGAVWLRGITIAGKAGQVVKSFAFIGNVTADAFQGVIVSIDVVDGFTSVRDDSSLSPDAKIRKMLGILANLAMQGALLYVSRKASATETHFNTTPPPSPKPPKATKPVVTDPPAKRLADVNDPKATIDTTEPPGLTGDTTDGAHTTTVYPDLPKPPIHGPPTIHGGGGGGGGGGPKAERLVVGRGKNTDRSAIPDPHDMNTRTLAPASAQAELTGFLQQAPQKFPKLVGTIREILLERMGVNPNGTGATAPGVTPDGISAARQLLEPGGSLQILQQPLPGQALVDVENQINTLLPASDWNIVSSTVHTEPGIPDAILVVAKKL